jgi:tetratricopeptide (TPR) repeat protein
MKQLMLLPLLLFALLTNAQTAKEYFEKAEKSFDSKEYKNAVFMINQAISMDGNKADYLLLKGNALFNMKEFEPAYNAFTKTIQLYPQNTIALNQRGLLLQTIGETEASIQDFDQALFIEKSDTMRISLYVNRGASKYNNRDFQGAYRDYLSAYHIDSMNIGTLNNLATVCDEIGKGDQTLAYLYKIITIDSTFTGSYANIGFKYLQMGEYQKAIPFFEKVLKMDPTEALAFNNRGFCRMKLGDLQGAMIDVNKSIELYPSNPYAYRNRALIFIEMNKIQDACNALQRSSDLGFTKLYGSEVDDLRTKYCLRKSI